MESHNLSEKEKMLAGMPYHSSPELKTDFMKTKELIYKYNNLEPSKKEEKKTIIRELIQKTGQKFTIEPPFRCDYGFNITIGENFYANYNLMILDCGKVKIGNNVFIGPNVSIFTSSHPIHHTNRETGIILTKPVSIGNNVWIGGGVIINPGVKIGDNSIIGAGSVVTKDIPPNVIAVGNPCKFLREITDDDIREDL